MPYTQNWGISRNAFQSPLNNDEVDIDLNPATDIVAENNSNALDEKMSLVQQKFGDIKESASKEEAEKQLEDKKYEDSKSTWTKTLNAIQDTASVGGLTPAVGAVVDVPNAITSWVRTATNAIGDTAKGIYRGNFDYRRTKEHFGNALLNTAAILPVVGHAATATRLGPKVSKTLDTIKTSAKTMKGLRAVDKTSDIAGIYGGIGSAGNLSGAFTGDIDKSADVGSDSPKRGKTKDTTNMYKYKMPKIIKKKLS